ncbi:MAG: hypothetical protein SCK28_07410 [Bacillota bacterium]|nr:hypothetical protein [Bacillota bacterium]
MEKSFILQHESNHSWLQPTSHKLITVVDGQVETNDEELAEELMTQYGFKLERQLTK